MTPDRYPLAQTPSDDYSQRTRWNVRDSDGTLVLSWGSPEAGTALTVGECRRAGKPHLVVDLADEAGRAAAVGAARGWLAASLAGGVLNVAGPRASRHPAVYDRARAFLHAVLAGGEE